MATHKIKQSDVVDEVLVCPYCMNERTYENRGCCGESSTHFEKALVTKDELFLESEVEIVPDLDYQKLVRNTDPYYEYSDDSHVYNIGFSQWTEIRKLEEQYPELKKLGVPLTIKNKGD